MAREHSAIDHVYIIEWLSIEPLDDCKRPRDTGGSVCMWCDEVQSQGEEDLKTDGGWGPTWVVSDTLCMRLWTLDPRCGPGHPTSLVELSRSGDEMLPRLSAAARTAGAMATGQIKPAFSDTSLNRN
jgi:hypothetical protein